MKIRPVGTELFHGERRTKEHTYMMELIVTLHNFATVPKKLILYLNTFIESTLRCKVLQAVDI
jgi:hypothetical protein